jgi:hypothetical protein
MALSQDDVEALGKLLDQRLEAHGKLIDQKLDERDRRARNRRRFWLWFWILVFVGSSVACWWTVQKLIGGFQDQIAQIENDTLQAKVAYQQQLARDRQMQRERAEVEKATGYRSDKDLGEFDAGLLRQAFQLLGKSADFQAKQKKPNAAAGDEDIDQQLKQVGDMTEQMSNLLGQLLLHETDPAHNTRTERLLAGEVPPPAAPAPVQADPAPAPPAK